MATARRPRATAPRPRAAPAERPRGAARREALIDATLRIVAEVGADAVTHRRVAQVADLPLASTTYWFHSREDLLTAALGLAAQRDVARLRAHVAGLGTGAVTSAQIVDAVAEPVADGSASSRGSLLASYALVLEAARRPALQEISRDWTDVYLDVTGELLARAGSSRPRDDARLLLGAVDGLVIDQLSGGRRADSRPELERLTRALLEAR